MTRAGARACVGCLGSGTCWVCEGSGSASAVRPGTMAPSECSRCGGSGRCSMCADSPAQPAPADDAQER